MAGGEVAGGGVAGGEVAGGEVTGEVTGGAVAGGDNPLECEDCGADGGAVVVGGAAIGGAVVVVEDVTGEETAGTTNQVPPIPWPLVSPGLVSPENRYRGIPLNVSWSLPAGPVTVPSSAGLTPPVPAAGVVPAGMVSGGHIAAQLPVQVALPAPSGEKR